MDADKLKNLLHIDSDLELANAVAYSKVAEQYLKNAGCKVDYDNSLFCSVVVSITAKMLTNPDLMSNLSESMGITLNGIIAQLRSEPDE